ncbi:MAG: response regulator, partial [Gammaproteobacteria bacterium]|nr:response regulator [Gammaproteobacteria bacterium]
PYELTILDWHMPEMDGIDLARQINADPALNATKIIMLTSAAAGESAKRMHEAGVDAHLTKPARPAHLRQSIAQVLKLKKQAGGHRDCESRGSQEIAVEASRIPPGTHILLVEDNPVNREVATSMLNVMQCKVHEVANGREAVEIVRRQKFDLVLMDCEMPVMDGYAATRAIREWEQDVPDHEHLPIVALTAHAMPEDRNRCLKAGMCDFLSKPFSMDELRSTIARWLPMSAGEPATGDDDPTEEGRQLSDMEFMGAVSTKALDAIGALDPAQGKDLATRVIAVYESSSADLVESLRDAFARDDSNKVRTTAHALKSSSGNVGAERLMAMCRELELAARDRELEGMAERLTALQEEHRQVIDELRKWTQS